MDNNSYWTFIGIVTNIHEDCITVSLTEPETNEVVYKLIPKDKIPFDAKENDFIKIEFTMDINNNLVEDYKVSYFTPDFDKEKRKRIWAEIEERKVRDDVI